MRKFIPVKTEPATNGRLNKIPVNASGAPINAHECLNWMEYNEAAAIGPYVGLVLTEEDDLFCVDLDEYSKSPAVQDEILSHFEGFYIEKSVSGDGYHILGTCDKSKLFEHKTDVKQKDSSLHLQFYTKKRFILITGYEKRGDIKKQDAGHINEFLLRWGPYADEPALKKAYGAKGSTKQILGGSASFADLFFRRTEKLARVYPHDTSDKDFDYSAADMALCDHLAFWLKGDEDKVRHYFSLSQLVRDKWEEREDYRNQTLAKACESHKKEVAEDIKAGFQYMPAEKQLEFFKGCTYVTQLDKVVDAQGLEYTRPQFNSAWGGYVFELDSEGGRSTDKAFDAFTLSRCYKAPKVYALRFNPKRADRIYTDVDGVKCLNSYVPTLTKPVSGDVSLFTNHMEKLFPEEHDRLIMMGYLAGIVQYPGVKFSWCPVIQGTKGNGKSFLCELMRRIVGPRLSYSIDKQRFFKGRFNGQLRGKLFIIVEECFIGNDLDAVDRFKELVTSSWLEIEDKGITARMDEVFFNFLMTTNHKHAIVGDEDERRLAVIFTPHQKAQDVLDDGLDNEYFRRLFTWMRAEQGAEKVYKYLLDFTIPDKYDPTKGTANKAPKPTCYQEYLVSSQIDEPALQKKNNQILENLKDLLDSEAPGIRGGYISVPRLCKLYYKETGSRITGHALVPILKQLGYETPPALESNNGRLRETTVLDEGVRPRIMMMPDHPDFNGTQTQIKDNYLNSEHL